jgi:hypothetical protein
MDLSGVAERRVENHDLDLHLAQVSHGHVLGVVRELIARAVALLKRRAARRKDHVALEARGAVVADHHFVRDPVPRRCHSPAGAHSDRQAAIGMDRQHCSECSQRQERGQRAGADQPHRLPDSTWTAIGP